MAGPHRDEKKHAATPGPRLGVLSFLVHWWFDTGLRTLVLVNIAAVVERADEALLPAVYNEVGHDFSASPAELGALSLARALVQALSFPLAAVLVLVMPRVSIIALGALVWGVATAGVGIATSYLQVALWRAANGVGLALVIPAIQSLVADSAIESRRGIAFGWLQFVTNSGQILGGVLGVTMAATRPLGIEGWRVAFLLVACVSVVLAAAVWAFAADPPKHLGRGLADPADLQSEVSSSVTNSSSTTTTNSSTTSGSSSSSSSSSISSRGSTRRSGSLWQQSLGQALRDTVAVLRVPSFCVIVAQGVVGSFPWAAFSFAAMWLELIGFTHAGTAGLLSMFAVAMCLGGVFGGWLGDAMTRRFPDSGRVIVAQVSSGFAIVSSWVLLRGIPQTVDNWPAFTATLIAMGFLISWNAAATNNPIFAEIVPEAARTNVYALDRTFEVAVAAFAPPTVGYLAEHFFGYSTLDSFPSPDHAAAPSPEAGTTAKNADALSAGLFWAMAVPFALCCSIYGLLYRTYPRDRDRVRAASGRKGVVQEYECSGEERGKDVEVQPLLT